ncbi:hypothetical protein CEE37_09380 [candidate division LCP-89 bacterium B3_LCP]|uniref:Methyltransferase type 11 domain-containing protein n=1 Tax=candidate division LCP-89 bacterium B3_LCP TaxID=2012998 RepID=A0A532UYA9_UNCL8|nr:MAG: hypothetical protein CEE37_09380 [candidate division LCP-89 bacterium B3_LCP]
MNASDPQNAQEQKLITEAQLNWNQHWKKITQLPASPATTGFSGAVKRTLRRSGGLELGYRIVKKEIRRNNGQVIMEAGCGTGEMSLRMALEGKSLFTLDTSRSALDYVKRCAKRSGIKVNIIQGSVLHLPFREAVFDATFNVGVLDHLGPQNRIEAAREMVRTLKPLGRTVILINSSRAFVHRLAVRCAEKKGLWKFGFKDAVHSLAKEVAERLRGCRIREYERGFLSQFEFLHYCIPQAAVIKRLFFRTFYLLTFPFGFLNRFAGQYLITVIEKSEVKDRRHR